MPHVQSIVKLLLASSCVVFLSACGGGGGGDSTSMAVASGSASLTAGTPVASPSTAPTPGAQLPSQTAVAPSGAPVITGQPVTAVSVGESYSFKPAASDPNGDRLVFSIENLPRWASFNETTGALLGTPGDADVGTYNNITISVSNSIHKSSLKPFSVSVTQISVGAATVNWAPPLKNTDGTVLTDLSGFQIHFGRSTSALTQIIAIKNASISRYVIDNLSSGTWYFAVVAVNSKGVQSDLSPVGSKVIG